MSNLHNPDLPIRMLIVDDEPVICQGLRMTIDWSAIGIEVIGEAYDGEHALEIIGDQPVELLISDIRMEGMDGLQLAGQLKQSHPHTRIIILSGYEDFEYARTSVRLGVYDYLLKPVEIDALVEVVKRAAAEIRSERTASAREEDLLWFTAAVRGVPSKAPLPDRSRWQGADFRILTSQLSSFAEVYAELSADDYGALLETWATTIREGLQTLGLRSMSVFDNLNLLYTFVIDEHGRGDDWWESELAALMSGWSGERPMYCALSPAYSRLEETTAACQAATQLLAYHVLDHRAVLLPADAERMRRQPTPEYAEQEWLQGVTAALYAKDAAEVRVQVTALFAQLQAQGLLLHEAAKVYEELMVLLRQRLRQSGLGEMEGSRQTPIDLHLYNTYESVSLLAANEVEQLLEHVDRGAREKSNWIAEKAVRYMREHSHTDLKASEAAAWLKITPSYFSYIFKKHTGKSFTEYMNELRINHAMELLATTHDKVFEIADQVGYREYKYFVSVFKTVAGMTPKEYRALKVKG
ncbi:DNA-binding response regulator [Paenibacillus sp. 598K]|uniref:response regulator transcription factor n=1 Tax=Paenibacillus sp. 598K TaxID=1117987 RepID=UPI000FF9BFDE|nr:response regulator [Paenibacillus sp. 598K]GBF77666.1 DNA-binding response regulator [Paenibacillus sp. 598K]